MTTEPVAESVSSRQEPAGSHTATGTEPTSRDLPQHGSTSAQGLTAAQLARRLGIQVSRITSYLKDERLSALVIQGPRGTRIFPPAAVAMAEKIKAERTAKVNPGLVRAWKTRRKLAAERRKHTTVAPKIQPAVPTERPARFTVSAAARQLGVPRHKLATVLDKHPRVLSDARQKGLTPEVIEQLRRLLLDTGAHKREAAREALAAASTQAAQSRDPVIAEALRLASRALDVNEKLVVDFRETVRELLAHQRTMLERLARPLRIRLDDED